MIADKCETILEEDEDGEGIECDQIAVGVTEDDYLICEECSTVVEDNGGRIDYFAEAEG
jgi:hypothetical protein